MKAQDESHGHGLEGLAVSGRQTSLKAKVGLPEMRRQLTCFHLLTEAT